MKVIKTDSGEYIRVDDEDFNQLNSVKWYIDKGYARNSKYGLMHRFIMSAPYGMIVDHINHDRHDNRKENLRIITAHENNIKANKHRRTAPNISKNFTSISPLRKINGYITICPGNTIDIYRPRATWKVLEDKSIRLND